jgi:hypothetical protein
VALGLGALVGLVLAALPLAGSLGPESALVLGLVLSPLAAAVGAGVVRDARRRRIALPTSTIAARAWGGALLIVAAPLSVLLLNLARVPSCAPLSGLAFELIGPVASVLVSATIGLWIATLVRAPRISTALAALAPIGEMAWALYRFRESPAIFAYGHAFGWFPGTLYDEGTTIGAPYFALRLGSLALVLGLVALHAALVDPATQRLSRSRLATRVPQLLVASLLLAGFALVEGHAEALGTRSSAESIREALGGRASSGRCTAIVPRELPRDEAQRLAEDCAFRLTQLERGLGVRPGPRVTAFFFRDVSEKRALMGAGDTYIAKPWRREVYLQLGEWPHPVLAHELAHVVAGDVASGPFRVGGQLGGLLPDAGMIEGMAVAMAWGERDGLTPHEWARAMLALGIAPTIEGTRGLSFLLEPAGRAYTISGSFYRFLFDRYGAGVVRRAYRTGDLAGAAGKPVAELAREWRAFIETVPLPDDALALARARFARGAIFARPCPHRVALLRLQLAGDLAANDPPRTVSTCREVLAIDPADTTTRAVLAGALARQGLGGDADRELTSLERRWEAPTPILSAAREAIADAAWRRGDDATALRLLSALEAQPRDEDSRRVLEVKLLALRAGGQQAALLGRLLAAETPPDGAFAVHVARELGAVRRDGLSPYLEARQLVNARRHADAVPMLRAALTRGLPTTLLTREARRMLATSLWATGARHESARLWAETARRVGATEPERLEARDWLTRARLAR